VPKSMVTEFFISQQNNGGMVDVVGDEAHHHFHTHPPPPSSGIGTGHVTDKSVSTLTRSLRSKTVTFEDEKKHSNESGGLFM